MKHLDQKYFTFRKARVAAASARYPDRAHILLASEYLRLGFVAVSALLCTVIFAILATTAAGRVGPLEWRTITFGLCAAACAAITLRTVGSLLRR